MIRMRRTRVPESWSRHLLSTAPRFRFAEMRRRPIRSGPWRSIPYTVAPGTPCYCQAANGAWLPGVCVH
jgi:hypothetical protein